MYALLCMAFSVIIGAAVFEHLAVWPQMYAAPPQSLTMIQGEYGLNGGRFWMIIHPVVLSLFIIVTILTWKTERRRNVWIPFAGYLLIMVVTTIYFVPELMAIGATPFNETIDAGLQQRGRLWINLSLLRLTVLVILGVYLYIGLTRASEKVANVSNPRPAY